MARNTPDDTSKIARDMARQNRPPADQDAPRLHRLAPGFVRVAPGVHPDHGQPVTYTPGEAIPAWLAQALDDGHGRVVDGGIIEIVGDDDEAPVIVE